MVISFLIVLTMIVLTSARVTSLLSSSLCAAFLMLITGCISVKQLWGSVNGELMLLIASSFSLGVALDTTGVAKQIADTMLKIFGRFGKLGILYGLFISTSLLTEIVSNAATVSLMFLFFLKFFHFY